LFRNRSDDFKAKLIERFSSKVLPHFESGKLKVYVDKVYKVDWSDATPVIYPNLFFLMCLVPRCSSIDGK